MRVPTIALLLLALVSCGRIGFGFRDDGFRDDGGTSGDAPQFRLDAGECPPNYSFSGNSCYRFVLDGGGGGLPWHGAEADCESDAVGAHLVVIDDVTEANTVDILVPPSVTDHWVGTSDLATPDAYLTVTNLVPGYLIWDSAEPNGIPGEDCLHMDSVRALHDTDCGRGDDYLCEYDGIAAVPAAYGQ